MISGSSQDTTWTFGGAVAAPAAGESTAEEVAMQSIDSSTEEGQSKAYFSSYPKDSPQSEERIESIDTFASNILRIKGSKGQWSGK